MRLLLVLLACGGCNVLFQLDTVPNPQDASAGGVDGSAAHDEDGDGVPDMVDNCPTVSNGDQLDVMEIGNGETADAVGDACDPNPIEMGDKIALFAPFTTRAGFVAAGTVSVSETDGDSLVLGGDSAVLSQAAVSAPTVAVVQLDWTGGLDDQNLATLTLGSNKVACGMEICSPGTCIYATSPGSSQGIGWGANASDLIEIRFVAVGEECDLATVSNTGQLGNTYPFAPGSVGFATTGSTSTVVLHNLIVYGH